MVCRNDDGGRGLVHQPSQVGRLHKIEEARILRAGGQHLEKIPSGREQKLVHGVDGGATHLERTLLYGSLVQRGRGLSRSPSNYEELA